VRGEIAGVSKPVLASLLSMRTASWLLAALLAGASPASASSHRGSGAEVVIPEAMPSYRLVQAGVMTRVELMNTFSDRTAASGADLEWTLARAFQWRPAKDTASREAWRQETRRRLGETPQRITVGSIVVACEKAARLSGFALAVPVDSSFRRSLITDIWGARSLATVWQDSVTRETLLSLVANARYPLVQILETTDFHGAMHPGAREDGRAVGGAAVLAAHVARLRANNPEGTVLLDGGDMFQGTMISNLSFGRSVVDHMNALGYTAAAIGNHEFDWGADTLVRRIREMRFAALGANLRERATGKRPYWARADTVVTRRGVKIGILGLSFDRTPSVTLRKHVAHLQFGDHVKTAAQLVPALAKRSDVVIGVGHVPATAGKGQELKGGDLRELAAVPGVAAWFGGHSHNDVCDEVGRVPCAIAGSHGRRIAVTDLVIDPIANRVISHGSRLQPTWADEVTPDSATAALVERWDAATAPLNATRLGHNERRLRRNREGESALGNFVTDAIRVSTSADIAFQNSGGLRADLEAGVITRGAIYEVMPFDNRIFLLDLTGAQVRLALEDALATGRVTQASGIRYVFDASRERMKRLVEISLADGSRLDEARTYRVAINDFMATGGDDSDVLRKGANRKETDVLVREAMEAFVKGLETRGAKLDYREEGRIRHRGGTTGD